MAGCAGLAKWAILAALMSRMGLMFRAAFVGHAASLALMILAACVRPCASTR